MAVGSTPDEFRAFVAEEIARWAKVIKDAEHQDGGVEARHVIPSVQRRDSEASE